MIHCVLIPLGCSSLCASMQVCLFVWTPSVEGKWVSLQGFCLTSGAGVVGNAPYQVLPTYVEPGIGETNIPNS